MGGLESVRAKVDAETMINPPQTLQPYHAVPPTVQVLRALQDVVMASTK